MTLPESLTTNNSQIRISTGIQWREIMVKTNTKEIMAEGNIKIFKQTLQKSEVPLNEGTDTEELFRRM